MNEKTVEKYNELFEGACPLEAEYDAERKQLFVTGPREHAKVAGIKILVVIDSKRAQATTEALREAAREMEFLDPGWGIYTTGDTRMIHGITSPIAVRAYQLAKPEIAALLQGMNKANAEAFEIYRLACAQGVAVPPTSPTSPEK